MPKPLPELIALDAFRRKNFWTFRALAEDMAAAGVEIPARTLHHLIKRPGGRPFDWTREKVRIYLAKKATAARRQRARKATTAKKATGAADATNPN